MYPSDNGFLDRSSGNWLIKGVIAVVVGVLILRSCVGASTATLSVSSEELLRAGYVEGKVDGLCEPKNLLAKILVGAPSSVDVSIKVGSEVINVINFPCS